MPLLGKEEFVLKDLPAGLDLSTEIFYCGITGEAFVSYDEYFSRQILCSSLLWTCSVTGKTNLTYADAVASEKESKNILSSVPRVLQKVLLHLMNHINNFSTNVVLAILFDYTNLRYFIGETIQILSKNKTGKKIKGVIRDVIPPENYETATSIAYGLDPLSYDYVVEVIGATDSENTIETIPASRISRNKFSLTRDKMRLFLKHHLSSKSSRYDTLSIKEESIHKFGLDHLQWEDIFKGPTPNFDDDTTVLKAFTKRTSNGGDVVVYNTSNNDSEVADNSEEETTSIQMVKKKSTLLTAQKAKFHKRQEKLKASSASKEISDKETTGKKKKGNKQKLKEKSKLQKAKKKKGKGKAAPVEPEEPVNTKEDKLEEKKRLKEARRKFEEDTRLWTEKRDDLLCDDLKLLPAPTPVDCDIDSNLFGDSLVILEFINSFKEYLNDFSTPFPSGISTDLFAQILNDSEIYGPYSDLLLILFDTILIANRNDNVDLEGDLKINNANDEEFSNLNEDDDSTNFSSNNFSNHWVATYFGTREQLSKLRLNPFTLSELLRIYILKARSTNLKKSRYIDDEYVELAIKLTTKNVFVFNQEERMCLFKLLLEDIVKIPVIRQKIEDSMEEISGLKTQIRHINAAFSKWLRDHPVRLRIRKKKPSDATDNKEEEGTVEEPQENEASEAEKEQYKKEKSQREQQIKKSISELKQQIRLLSSFCRPRPLGLDRAFRRYWIFQSVPGLLVEHPIEERPCLEVPIPMAKPKLTDYLPNARRRKSKNAKKEETAEIGENDDPSLQTSSATELARCTGDLSSCSVHGTVNTQNRIRWAFYTQEQLDDLISSLSTRGQRENELKIALNIEKNSILNNHLECFVPISLNRNYLPPIVYEIPDSLMDENNLLRKSERIQNQAHEKAIQGPKHIEPAKHVKSTSKYSNVPPSEAIEREASERLLALEDQIFNSCFTSFTLTERDSWWNAVSSNSAGDTIKSVNCFTSQFRILAKSLRPFCLLPPLSVIPDSAVSSPSDKENIEHILPKIQKISEKWTDVLKTAEGLSTGQLNDFESSFGISTLSQLFVNVYILEKSINWELSALKTATKCRVCRRKANDNMILCDMCNRGYHIYCLKPPIESIDEIEGDWFCHFCVPTSVTTTSKKNFPQKSINSVDVNNIHSDEYTEDTQSYTSDDAGYVEDAKEGAHGEICRACKDHLIDKYSEVSCKTCNRGFHLHCVNLVRVPRSWSCLPCEAKETYNSTQTEDTGDVRRSSRKRRPNHYYDDEEAEEMDDATFYPGNTKSRRYSLEDRTHMQRIA